MCGTRKAWKFRKKGIKVSSITADYSDNSKNSNKYKAVVRDVHIVAKDYNDTGHSDKLIFLLENILAYGAMHKEDAFRRKIKFDFFTYVYEKEF